VPALRIRELKPLSKIRAEKQVVNTLESQLTAFCKPENKVKENLPNSHVLVGMTVKIIFYSKVKGAAASTPHLRCAARILSDRKHTLLRTT